MISLRLARLNHVSHKRKRFFAAVVMSVSLTLSIGVHSCQAQPSRLTMDGLFKQRPHWHPDGSRFVFARHRGDTIFLYVHDMKSGEESRLTMRDAPEYDAVYSPDGKSLLFAFDKTSPNQGDLEVYRFVLEDKSLHPVAVTSGGLSHEESPAWAPDGQRVAFSSTRDGNQELYTCSIQGGEWTRLTSDPAIDAHPCWSPDGEWIAFATNRWGDLEIARIRPDGTGLTRLTDSPGLDDYPSWSPDGNRIAFTSNRDRNFEILVMQPDGKGVHNLSNHPAIDNFPAWIAPRTLGWVSNRDGGFDVYTMRLTEPD